jgi:hypothetical protein
MDPRYSYFADDLILLDKNVPNNGESEGNFYQIHAGDEIVNRDNTANRPNSRILSDYRDIDSKISFVFSDFQIMGNIEIGKNKNNDNNSDKKIFRQYNDRSPLFRSSLAKRNN